MFDNQQKRAYPVNMIFVNEKERDSFDKIKNIKVFHDAKVIEEYLII